jgi:hypothetical protein
MPTEAKDIFEAITRSLREMLTENGLGLYIPPYQRHYSWNREKVEKLIDDTLHGLKNLGSAADSFTFLGSVITIHDVNYKTVNPVVKTEVPAKVLTVIDGQQRLSTLMLLLVCLHNLIRQKHYSVFKGKAPDAESIAYAHLHAETVMILMQMASAFYERQQIGDSPIYPRLIRAFKDQWAKNAKNRLYESPIAHLIFQYASLVDSELGQASRPTDFKPAPRPEMGDGEVDLVKRYTDMRKILGKLAKGDFIENVEELPGMEVLAKNGSFQRALFNHELDETFAAWLCDLDDGKEIELARLVMLGAYVLNRIALTVVKGKDEDYAFTIFESLNTTGEPLTAFETFLPRVVSKEGLENYHESTAHEYMVDVESHLARFPVGERRQNATRDLLVSFALAENGTKLSKRLADQRAYMKDVFDQNSQTEGERDSFLRHLRDTATFVGRTWDPDGGAGSRQLVGLDPSAMTDSVRMCLSFLKDIGHTIAIAPLVRFYSDALHCESHDKAKKVAEFDEAIKAITAFTVFWRASRRGTGNIDSQYREIMAGNPTLAPLARSRKDGRSSTPTVDCEQFKKELVARLMDGRRGNLQNLNTFVSLASLVPQYSNNNHIARFLLLAAHHDAVEDLDHPGLIKDGKTNSNPCLTADGWNDEGHLTIEHVAPRTKTADWPLDFYADRDTVHRIGNLVLSPSVVNSSLGGRPWDEKRVLYAALGQRDAGEAKSVLFKAAESGITFAMSTEDLVNESSYLPHLRALGQRTDLEFDVAFTDERARCLLERAARRLGPWLDLNWSETDDAQVTLTAEDVELDDEEYVEGALLA